MQNIILITPEDLAELAKQSHYAVDNKAAATTAIDTHVTPKLAAEGLAREVVHRLQNMRRSAGFDIADHIITYYDGDSYVKQVMHDWADYIKQETLSRELVEGVPEEDAFTESCKLSGYEIRLGVKRVD